MPVFEFSQCAGDFISYCWKSFVFLTDYRFDFCSVCLVYQACKLSCHRCNVLSSTGLFLLMQNFEWLREVFFSFSLHALKDESYIRQTLQRQAAALHHAAVSYAVSVWESMMHKRSYKIHQWFWLREKSVLQPFGFSLYQSFFATIKV